MSPGPRAANRAAKEAEILRLGREHLHTHGAAGLSLRAIARDLGVVSSAVYRYVPSRDDLLTALLVEAYDDLADAVEERLAQLPDDGPRLRLRACADTMRAWALADPARWTLLYGSPVPGYSAPAERTVGPGTRVVALMLAEFAHAATQGLLIEPRPDVDLVSTTTGFNAIRHEFGTALTDGQMAVPTTLWATTIGGISLEVFGQYGTDVPHLGALFGAQIDVVLSLAFD